MENKGNKTCKTPYGRLQHLRCTRISVVQYVYVCTLPFKCDCIVRWCHFSFCSELLSYSIGHYCGRLNSPYIIYQSTDHT